MATSPALNGGYDHMRPYAFLTLALLLAGCSSKPSEALIRRQLNEAFAEDLGPGVVRIENLKKTNGYEKPPNLYVAQVECDLVFLKDLAEVSEQLREQAVDRPLGGLAAGVSTLALGMAFGDFEAGDSRHLERDLELIRTEKGWRIYKQ